MTHWKKLMDPKDWLFAFDLEGRDVTVTITHVVGGELTGEQGRKSKKPVAHLKGTKKLLALNVTNCKTIQQLTGTGEVEKWRDLRVTLFPTTTNFGGDTVDCIRIRPYHPKESDNGKSGGNKRGGGSQREQASDELTDAIADKMRESGASVPRDTDGDDEPDAEQANA